MHLSRPSPLTRRTSYYKAMEWERERRYEERPGLLHIVGSRQEKALEWMG